MGSSERHQGPALRPQLPREAGRLKAIVKCGVCGGTMQVVRFGKAKHKLTYGCTASSRDFVRLRA